MTLFAAPLAAQSYVTSPRNYDTTEGNAAFANWGPSRRLQGIDNTQKGTPLVIKQLAFRRDGTGSAGSAARTMDITVVMGTMTWGILSTTMDDNFTPGSQLTAFTKKNVNFPDWSAAPPAPPAAFDFTLPFDTPFVYLGLTALVWSVSNELSSNTGLVSTDRQYVAYTPTNAAGVLLGTGCVSTGQSATYGHTMTIGNANVVADMALTASVTAAPANAAVYLFLDAINSNLVIPGMCATIFAYPRVNVVIGTASATGALSNKVLQFPYNQALEGQQIYSQCLSVDVGQPGFPVSISAGRSTTVPTSTLAAGMQAAYQWSSLPTVTSTVFYGGSVIARLGY